jgi:hypothetical protein
VNKCGNGIVGTDKRGSAAAWGDDPDYPFLRLGLHPRLVLVPMLPAGPFKLE